MYDDQGLSLASSLLCSRKITTKRLILNDRDFIVARADMQPNDPFCRARFRITRYGRRGIATRRSPREKNIPPVPVRS